MNKFLLALLICSSALYAPTKIKVPAIKTLLILNKTNKDLLVETAHNGHYVRSGTRHAIKTNRATEQVTINGKTFCFNPKAKQITIDWGWDKYNSGLVISEQPLLPKS